MSFLEWWGSVLTAQSLAKMVNKVFPFLSWFQKNVQQPFLPDPRHFITAALSDATFDGDAIVGNLNIIGRTGELKFWLKNPVLTLAGPYGTATLALTGEFYIPDTIRRSQVTGAPILTIPVKLPIGPQFARLARLAQRQKPETEAHRSLGEFTGTVSFEVALSWSSDPITVPITCHVADSTRPDVVCDAITEKHATIGSVQGWLTHDLLDVQLPVQWMDMPPGTTLTRIDFANADQHHPLVATWQTTQALQPGSSTSTLSFTVLVNQAFAARCVDDGMKPLRGYCNLTFLHDGHFHVVSKIMTLTVTA